jgi:hypothetical protein
MSFSDRMNTDAAARRLSEGKSGAGRIVVHLWCIYYLYAVGLASAALNARRIIWNMLNKIVRGIGSIKTGFETEIITAGMVHDSLDRLDDGTFGKCRCCGRSIPAGTLAANPAARLCGQCRS